MKIRTTAIKILTVALLLFPPQSVVTAKSTPRNTQFTKTATQEQINGDTYKIDCVQESVEPQELTKYCYNTDSPRVKVAKTGIGTLILTFSSLPTELQQYLPHDDRDFDRQRILYATLEQGRSDREWYILEKLSFSREDNYCTLTYDGAHLKSITFDLKQPDLLGEEYTLKTIRLLLSEE